MTDVEAKRLFEKYASNCCYFRVDGHSKTLTKHPIDVKELAIDKDGNLVVGWRDNVYDELKYAPLNEIKTASSNYVEGVFTAECYAVSTTEQHFNRIRDERIAELEAELRKLKEEQ